MTAAAVASDVCAGEGWAAGGSISLTLPGMLNSLHPIHSSSCHCVIRCFAITAFRYRSLVLPTSSSVILRLSLSFRSLKRINVSFFGTFLCDRGFSLFFYCQISLMSPKSFSTLFSILSFKSCMTAMMSQCPNIKNPEAVAPLTSLRHDNVLCNIWPHTHTSIPSRSCSFCLNRFTFAGEFTCQQRESRLADVHAYHHRCIT